MLGHSHAVIGAPGEDRVIQPRFLDVAPATFDTLDMAEGNALLTTWGHRLGQLHRPFTSRCYVFLLDGEPISLAMSASIISGTVQVQPDAAGELGRRLRRTQVVELARLCSAPGQAWASRVMIRVWREVFAPRWPDWPVAAAISYSQNAHHRGDLYRFDGWTAVRTNAGASLGAGTWSKKRSSADPEHGLKTLWVWRYGS
jgi:hypothetical protein